MNIVKNLLQANNLFKSNFFYIDIFETTGNLINLKGWIFNKKQRTEELSLCFKTSEQIKKIKLDIAERTDVFNVFKVENAKHSGFEFTGFFSIPTDAEVYLECVFKKGTFTKSLGKLCANAPATEKNITVNKIINGYFNFSEFKNRYVGNGFTPSQQLYNTPVDVIIPIYNGFDYLENLFKTIQKTKMNYRLIIINDCSPDERVIPCILEFAQNKDNVIFIDNPENLGFVQSVNKALMLSDRDVALVNSDVILPEMWLERLMQPIVSDKSIASVTPFTNSGTICSFPNFCEDNNIFLDLDVNDIDKEFKNFIPACTPMPTGVGFCMGMSRKAINDVGILDAETFYKGYGEENDWCQRAIKKGYKNIHIENLFVYHKHGASFPSEEKKRYIERNLVLLNQMHPNYNSDVQAYIKNDPVKYYREYAKWKIVASNSNDNIIIFDHNWGGGAESYCKKRVAKELDMGKGIIKIVNDSTNGLYGEFLYQNIKTGFGFKDFEELNTFLNDIKITQIVINELVSFNDIYTTLEYILSLKNKFNAELIMLGHDYYSVCPSIYLIDNNKKHCFKPAADKCETCMKSNADSFNTSYESMTKWREKWGHFLKNCDKVTVFSNNTREYFLHWYPFLVNIEIVPHVVDYIKEIGEYKKDNNKITIGILGNFMRTKGSDIVFEMLETIRNEELNVEILVIGENLEPKTDKDLKTTGRYKVENLADIIKDNKINIIFIASIWPETFSYTTEEVIKMNIPVASFNLGAQAERISKYDKGLIISELNSDTALNEIINFCKGALNG